MTKQEYIDKLSSKGRTDVVLVGDYIDSKTKTLFQCTKDSCKHMWYAAPAQVMSGTGCPECRGTKLKTYEEFLKEFYQKGDPNIEILGQYQGRNKKILVRCKTDGYEWEILAKTLLKGGGCPVCVSKVILPNINSLAAKRPDLLKYFENSEDAYHIAPYSTQFVNLICPDCQTIRRMRASDLTNQGFSCQICSDSISYPNKFIRCVMLQLKDDVNALQYEWTPKWSNGKRYDVYFIKANKQYVIEMQGLQHYGSYGWNKNANPDDVIAQDIAKADMAIKHNVTPIIIDARISDADFIIGNIKKSMLSEIFTLSDIDWEKCKQDAEKSIIKQVCDDYHNFMLLITELAEKYNVDRHTIVGYLKKGNELGWCTYSPKNSKKIKVNVFDLNMNYIGQYASMSECACKLSEMYDIKVLVQIISKACKNKCAYYDLFFEYA